MLGKQTQFMELGLLSRSPKTTHKDMGQIPALIHPKANQSFAAFLSCSWLITGGPTYLFQQGSFLFVFIHVYVCIPACLCVHQVVVRRPCDCWKSYSCPLQEQVLLTFQLFLLWGGGGLCIHTCVCQHMAHVVNWWELLLSFYHILQVELRLSDLATSSLAH